MISRRLGEKNCLITVSMLTIALIISICVTSCMGAVTIPVKDTFNLISYHLFGTVSEGTPELIGSPADMIIWNLRFPRIILGIAAGAGLSTAGVIMQAVIQNPLAEPYILGISSGASLAATFSLMLGFGNISIFGLPSSSVWSFLGAAAASAAVLILASSGSRVTSAKLILSGAIINALCSAFSNFIVTVAADAEGMMELKFWTMGSLARAKWDNITFPCITVSVILLLCSLSFRTLNTMMMGDDAAITLGVDISLFRKLFLGAASLLTGILVSICGIIGFVGLIIPHAARAVTGADHRRVIPVSALSGSLFLLWADAFARSMLHNTELPIGILTSIVGAPIFVYIMLKKNYSFKA